MTQTQTQSDWRTLEGRADPGSKTRCYCWALSKDVSAELRIVGDPLTQAEADRLYRYVELTLGALVTPEPPVTMALCGPSRPRCMCRCPETCEHQWTGEWVEETLPNGVTTGTRTCARCGMRAGDHDGWVRP